MELKQKRIVLLITGILLILLNIWSYIICKNADVNFERYREISYEYKNNLISDDAIQNVQIELETGTKIIGNALVAFIIKTLIGGCLLYTLCIFPRRIFEVVKEEYLRSLIIPDDKIGVIIELIILLLFINDLVSSFGEINNYVQVYKEMTDVLASIHFEQLIKVDF